MALKTVSSYKDSVAAILSGLDLSNVDNLNGALERAARTMVQKADVPEASGIQNITLFAGVYDYLCDTRIFGTSINDIRPQGISRNPWDQVVKVNQQDFDRNKKYYYPSGTMSTFEWQNGTPIIRIVAPFPKQQIIIDPMNAIGISPTDWVASGTASGLTVDQTNYYQSPASLRMTVTGAGTGVLTKTLQNALSMATYQGVGTAFLAIQIPQGTTATELSRIELRLGSNSSNYSAVIVTEGFIGSWVPGDWLLVSFDFSTASDTGTPDWSAITYVEVRMGTLGTIVNFRVGDLFMSLPAPAQILYQSAAIFLPVGSSTPLTTITSDTDRIILNDAAYTIYEFEGAISICQQTGGTTGSATIATCEAKLNGARARNGTVLSAGLYDLYRGDNPSQELRLLGSWYENGDSYNTYGNNC